MEPTNILSLPFITREMFSYEDNVQFGIRLRSSSSGSGNLTIRGTTKDGPFVLQHTVDGLITSKNQIFNLPDIPTLIGVFDEEGNFRQGTTWVQLDLVVNGDVIYELAAGWVSGSRALTWPNNNASEKMPGRAGIMAKNSTNPAANVEASITVPTGRLWRLISASITLVADANAANRRVHLVVTSGNGGPVLDFFGTTDQIANETKKYTFAHFGATPDETDDNDILVNIPKEIYIFNGGTVATATVNRQVGDNFGTLDLEIEEIADNF